MKIRGRLLQDLVGKTVVCVQKSLFDVAWYGTVVKADGGELKTENNSDVILGDENTYWTVKAKMSRSVIPDSISFLREVSNPDDQAALDDDIQVAIEFMRSRRMPR